MSGEHDGNGRNPSSTEPHDVARTGASRCLDYFNGGCVFWLDQLPRSHSKDSRGGGPGEGERHVQPLLGAQQRCCPEVSAPPPSVSVLAEYEELGPGAAAAVR